jgi:hypothetical protein
MSKVRLAKWNGRVAQQGLWHVRQAVVPQLPPQRIPPALPRRPQRHCGTLSEVREHRSEVGRILRTQLLVHCWGICQDLNVVILIVRPTA